MRQCAGTSIWRTNIRIHTQLTLNVDPLLTAIFKDIGLVSEIYPLAFSLIGRKDMDYQKTFRPFRMDVNNRKTYITNETFLTLIFIKASIIFEPTNHVF